jgi:hypothetical protein
VRLPKVLSHLEVVRALPRKHENNNSFCHVRNPLKNSGWFGYQAAA